MKIRSKLLKSFAVGSISATAIIIIVLLIVSTLNTAFPVGSPIRMEIAVLLLMIVWIYISMILARIVYEAGHVIAGNTCGYDFVAIGVCGIWLLKNDKRIYNWY